MRVDILYVICIRRAEIDGINFQDRLFLDEAKALALRSVGLEKTTKAIILDYAPCTYKDKQVVNIPKQISAETVHSSQTIILSGKESSEDKKRIGAYIIAHGNNEGMSGVKFSDLATIFNSHGIKKLDKLSVVSCNIGDDYAGDELPKSWELEGVKNSEFKSYLSRMCGFLGANGYGNGDDEKIMVAGWNTYVTIAYPGRSQTIALGKKTTKNEKWKPLDEYDVDKVLKMNSGRKYAQDATDKNKKKPVHEIRKKNSNHVEAKVFFAWNKKSGLHPIGEKEWTDKKI